MLPTQSGPGGGAGLSGTRVGGIVGRGTVERAEARSVAGLCFGQAETYAEDARLAWHVIVNIEQRQFFNAPLTLAKSDTILPGTTKQGRHSEGICAHASRRCTQ